MVTSVSASPSFDASRSGRIVSTFSVALNKRKTQHGSGGSTFHRGVFDVLQTAPSLHG